MLFLLQLSVSVHLKAVPAFYPKLLQDQVFLQLCLHFSLSLFLVFSLFSYCMLYCRRQTYADKEHSFEKPLLYHRLLPSFYQVSFHLYIYCLPLPFQDLLSFLILSISRILKVRQKRQTHYLQSVN